MSYEALIRFAPETSVARLNDERRNGRTLYDTSQLRTLPSEPTIPLVQDHNIEKQLGTVTDLMRLQDLDGWWLCAVATLETCPSWLKRGTRASFQYRELQHDSFGNNICRAGIVSEVSVLSPGVEPYEPLAQVLYVKPIEPKAQLPPKPKRLLENGWNYWYTDHHAVDGLRVDLVRLRGGTIESFPSALAVARAANNS